MLYPSFFPEVYCEMLHLAIAANCLYCRCYLLYLGSKAAWTHFRPCRLPDLNVILWFRLRLLSSLDEARSLWFFSLGLRDDWLTFFLYTFYDHVLLLEFEEARRLYSLLAKASERILAWIHCKVRRVNISLCDICSKGLLRKWITVCHSGRWSRYIWGDLFYGMYFIMWVSRF